MLPIRLQVPVAAELIDYLRWLSDRVELIVVDGSPGPIFTEHARQLSGVDIVHLQPAPDVRGLVNGKVAGVLSGVRRASYSSVIIADDDVRYDLEGLQAMAAALDRADVVRPQNYFDPVPWHACLDTARTLLNRVTGGDWPGTLGVRRPVLIATGGYDGDVLFENFELVQTVKAAGGLEDCALGLYVRRLPPSTGHFFSQRVRQAYDEVARPLRLAIWLGIAPAAALLMSTGLWLVLAAAMASTIAAAEAGRRRAGGTRVFPAVAALLSPIWVVERAICAWLAIAAYTFWGGIPYRGRIVGRAATPVRRLQQRFKRADSRPQRA